MLVEQRATRSWAWRTRTRLFRDRDRHVDGLDLWVSRQDCQLCIDSMLMLTRTLSYAINPARDFGPRLALWCLGYGTQLWTHDSWWWLIGPICGTLVGSIIGALLYDACIYCGPGSPLNSSADELAYALHLPRMHNMVRTHLYPVDSEQRAQAQRELSIEAGLEKQEIAERRKARGKSPQGEEGTGRTQNETEMRSRWEAAKSKAEKEDRKRRARRRRKVEELLAEAQERTPRQQQEADVGEQRAGPEA